MVIPDDILLLVFKMVPPKIQPELAGRVKLHTLKTNHVAVDVSRNLKKLKTKSRGC